MWPNRGVPADDDQFLRHAGRRLRSSLHLTILAAALCTLILLAGAVGLLSPHATAPTALAAPFLPISNPTISLVSPQSGRGPVGATLTVEGNTGGASQVAIGAATTAANCANPSAGSSSGWVATFGTAQGSNDTYTFSFTWPASQAASAPYFLCAANAQPGSTGVAPHQPPYAYTVLSAQPPTLSLSSSTVQVGQPFTITGNNFYGESTINISINNAFDQAAHPDSGGSFIVTVTPTAGQTGNANILAQSPREGGGSPVLTATAQITVLAASTVTPDVTPTPSASPSVEATPTSANSGGSLSGGGGGSSTSGGGNGLVIALIIAIVLILLVIAGAIVFLVMRRRGGGGPAYPGGPGAGGPGGPGGGGWDGYPGPGRGTGPVPQYGQGATGRYGATGAYGTSGFYAQQDATTGPQVGGVAQWDDAPPMGGGASWDAPGDSAPGPDWQPRPMSNSRRRYDDPGDSAYGTSEEVPVDPYGAPQPGGYAPPDPWGNTAGGYGGPTQGYAPPNRGATGYPPYPARRQPPEDDWNGGEENGGDWNPDGGRGPGGTNPANQGW